MSIEKWAGDGFGLRSLAVCLALSFFYVVFTGLIAYGFGDSGIGSVLPFARPDWATAVPKGFLAVLCAVTLLGSGVWAFQLVHPDGSHRRGALTRITRVALGAGICGAGCAIARVFGAEPIAVAMTVALFAFGALSAWSLQFAALAGIAGAFIAGVGNGFVDERGLPFEIVVFLVFGGLLGAVSGGSASYVAHKIPHRWPAVLAGSGTGVAVGAIGAGLAIALAPQLSETEAHPERLVVLMWVVLPLANAVSDYLSLGVSLSLGRLMRRPRISWTRIAWVILLDVLAALLLMVVTLLLIRWGLSLGESVYGIEFSSADYIANAVASPWNDGLWLSLMVLTTLMWTYLHWALVIAPVVAAKIVGHFLEAPLLQRITHQSRQGRIDTVSSAWLAFRYGFFLLLVVLFAIVPVWVGLMFLDDLLNAVF